MPNFWLDKKVLVTGGDGFIGQFLVAKLLELKAQVFVSKLVGGELIYLNNFRDKINIIEGDLLDEKFCQQILKDIDYCFHLAAFKKNFRYHTEKPLEVLEKNLKINSNIINNSGLQNIKKLLVMSSATVYAPSDEFLTEDSNMNASFNNNDAYSWGKIILEQEAKFLNKQSDLEIKIARCDNIYGPGDNFDKENAQIIPMLISKTYDDSKNELEVWGSGDQLRTFLYVKDCINGLIAMMENNQKFLLLNLSSSEKISVKELIFKILNIAGVDKKIIFDKTKPEGHKIRVCDNELALKCIDWQPLFDMNKGLRETINYYKKHGKSFI